MATQQDVIKAFMRALDETILTGADALDAAICDCSNGRFADMQDLIDSFIRDVENHSGYYSNSPETVGFLRDYCGIILDNADTGAITGSDAHGLIEKTADSIVAEPATVIESFPSGGRSTINGLTFIWPDRSTLSADEAAIADRLYTWWAKGALDLIQESFGMNFQEAGAFTREITVNFYNKEDNALASVGHIPDYYTGKSSDFTLNINMFYYAGFNRQDTNGASNNDSAGHLDRTLAHEFVHAIMAANIHFVDKLPKFVKEGLAELVHGIDDARPRDIRLLATTQAVSALRELFSIRGTLYNYGSQSYAGGYMLFRYLAKQTANEEPITTSLPSGIIYNGNKTTASLLAPFSGIWDSADYADTVRTINANEETNAVTIKAGNNNNIIVTGQNQNIVYGQGGDDTIYSGNGKDILYYGTGDGADTVYNFQSGKDVLHFYNNAQLGNVTTSGANVILHSGNGSITLADKANQRVDIIDTANKSAVYYFGYQDRANTFVYGANQRYYGSAKYKDTLQVNAGATVSLANTTLYHDIDTIDATRSKAAVKLTGGVKAATLYGSVANDTLSAGSASTTLIGGKGNDTLYGGAANDVFYYAQGDGNDTITNFAAGTDKIRYTSGSLSKVLISGNDVLLYNGAGYQKLAGKAFKGQYADIIGTNGRAIRHNFGRNAAANTWNYAAGQGYHSSSKVDTLTITGVKSYNVNLNAASLYTSIDNVDASKATAAMTITGTATANTVFGTNKNDTLKAGAGNDILKGNAGNDRIYGDTGNDSLYGGKGNDTLYGGAGNDVFYYAQGDGNDILADFTAGADKIRYTSGSLSKVLISGRDVLLYNGTGYQKLAGKAFKGQYANIIGTNGRTVRHNFGRNATANAWNYTAGQGYHGSSKVDTLTITGPKSCNINLSAASLYTSIDNVNAARATASMTLTGTSAANVLIGSSKNDILKGGAGNDKLQGGNGDDKLYAQSGNNQLYGGAGNDYLEGGTGTDTLRGGTGNDTIKCGRGVDKMQFYKGDGKDTIQSAAKNDVLYLYNISNLKTQARFSMSGKNLVMSFTNNSNDRITLTNWSTNGMNNFVAGGKTCHLKVTNRKVSVR